MSARDVIASGRGRLDAIEALLAELRASPLPIPEPLVDRFQASAPADIAYLLRIARSVELERGRPLLWFTAYGKPVPTPRKKFTTRQFGAKGFVRPMAEKADAPITVWRHTLREAVREAVAARPLALITTPVVISGCMVMPRPSALIHPYPKARKPPKRGPTPPPPQPRPMPRVPIAGRGDLDNIVKGVQDALGKKNGVSVWTDDNLVARYHDVEKVAAAGWYEAGPDGVPVYHEEPPRLMIIIRDALVAPRWEERSGWDELQRADGGDQ